MLQTFPIFYMLFLALHSTYIPVFVVLRLGRQHIFRQGEASASCAGAAGASACSLWFSPATTRDRRRVDRRAPGPKKNVVDYFYVFLGLKIFDELVFME